MDWHHDDRCGSFVPETLESRVLLSFSATSDTLPGPIHDSDHASSLGPAQFDAVAQPGTEHDGFRIRVRNDGAPGEAFTRTFISLDQTLDASDVLVQQTDSVLIQNGDQEYIPESSADAHFTMPELPEAFLGKLAYSIVQVLDSSGNVQQTLVGTQPTYIHASQPGQISLIDPSYEIRRENLLGGGGGSGRSRGAGALNQGFSLKSATNRQDATQLFAGSEAVIAGSITLAARDAGEFYKMVEGESEGKTFDIAVQLVGLDGSVSTIAVSEDSAFESTFSDRSRRSRRGESSVNAEGRFVELSLSSSGVLSEGNQFSLPADLTPGAKFIRTTVTIEGHDPLVFTTDRPDVFISDGATSDLRWEDASWVSSSSTFADPAGPGYLNTNRPSNSRRDRRGASDESTTGFTFNTRSADAGRIEEARMAYLVRDGRVAFALVPAGGAAQWDPAAVFTITPSSFNGIDLAEPGALDAYIAGLSESPFGPGDTSFTLASLGNTRAVPAGEYRVAALILNNQSDASDGPISAEVRHSSVASDTEYSNNLVVSADSITLDQEIPVGGLREPTPADEFIEGFRESYGEGLAEGDKVTDELRRIVTDAAYAQADWTAENYWFQDGSGNVWSLWHGGEVHRRSDNEHNWVLTNLSDAGGLLGEIEFAPGSMSGVIASWRAFSIQGVADGQLVSLWWSPESGQLEWGNRSNGWVLTPFTREILRSPETGESVADLPTLRSYTETQSNGRFTFDPRPDHSDQHGGMSITLVDINENVYVATFSTPQQPEGAPVPSRPGVWLLERLDDVPGIERFDLRSSIDTWRFDIRARANR